MPERLVNEVGHFHLLNTAHLLDEQADLTHGLSCCLVEHQPQPWPRRA